MCCSPQVHKERDTTQWLNNSRKTECSESCHTWVIFFYKQGIQIRTNQRKRHIELSMGEFHMQSFHHPQDVLPSRHWSVTVLKKYCQPQKLTWALLPSIFIGASLQRFDWLNYCTCDWIQSPVSLPSLEVRLIPWVPKSQPSNHIIGLLPWSAPTLNHLVSINYPGAHQGSPC